VASANVYLLGVSAVDEGEIRYGGSTQYTTAQEYSFDLWNDLGEVDILPDTIWTYEDVQYGDYYDEDDGAVGYYQPLTPYTDLIRFNEYYFDSYTSSYRKMAASHELGHALGLDHSNQNNIMCSYATSRTTLGVDDIDSYNYLY
jgi:hypothetical protein